MTHLTLGDTIETDLGPGPVTVIGRGEIQARVAGFGVWLVWRAGKWRVRS